MINHDIAGVTLGTAGHIDHGKSALVRTLTGIEPDQLKEEQARGMTIDLGYAFYTTNNGRQVGVIDVPGHEKFVKNMVTGASSINIVILVVAADDGVMPQTREHLEIMEVMGIRRGLVALTKIDLVDHEMRDLARQDIEELLEGTFLEGARIFPLSSQSGEGFDPFKEHLEELIEEAEYRSPSRLFRMPVQRAFSAKGFGTVTTGVPISGTVSVGDTVEILPQEKKGKIRGMQAFGSSCSQGRAGHRVALNVADVDYQVLCRGSTVATPGYFQAVHFFEGYFSFFK
ncbi:MAG: selenocysteine-specific translation elongation factor, partial [Planctomycetes bacterium]|nr:selenocysteine-specific translation elongation factor [Planctomycetota bacterium]